MTRPESPTWLVEATSTTAQPDNHALKETEPTQVLPGDLCVVQPYELQATLGCLILVTDTADGWCEGMLASAELELATEVDVILHPAQTGLEYPVAVHSRFVGPIWTVQVRRRIGAVTADVLGQVLALGWVDEPAGVSLQCGLPLQPEGIDPRYPALAAMSAELDALTAHCRHRRHDLAPPILDPVLARVDVLRTILKEDGWDDRVDAASASPAFRDQLLKAYPRLTKDEQRAAMPFLERATISRTSSSPILPPSLVAEHRDPGALSQAIGVGSSAQPVITVLTHRQCWTTWSQSSFRMSAEQETIVVIEAVSDLDLLEVA